MKFSRREVLPWVGALPLALQTASLSGSHAQRDPEESVRDRFAAAWGFLESLETLPTSAIGRTVTTEDWGGDEDYLGRYAMITEFQFEQEAISQARSSYFEEPQPGFAFFQFPLISTPDDAMSGSGWIADSPGQINFVMFDDPTDTRDTYRALGVWAVEGEGPEVLPTERHWLIDMLMHLYDQNHTEDSLLPAEDQLPEGFWFRDQEQFDLLEIWNLTPKLITGLDRSDDLSESIKTFTRVARYTPDNLDAIRGMNRNPIVCFADFAKYQGIDYEPSAGVTPLVSNIGLLAAYLTMPWSGGTPDEWKRQFGFTAQNIPSGLSVTWTTDSDFELIQTFQTTAEREDIQEALIAYGYTEASINGVPFYNKNIEPYEDDTLAATVALGVYAYISLPEDGIVLITNTLQGAEAVASCVLGQAPSLAENSDIMKALSVSDEEMVLLNYFSNLGWDLDPLGNPNVDPQNQIKEEESLHLIESEFGPLQWRWVMHTQSGVIESPPGTCWDSDYASVESITLMLEPDMDAFAACEIVKRRNDSLSSLLLNNVPYSEIHPVIATYASNDLRVAKIQFATPATGYSRLASDFKAKDMRYLYTGPLDL